MAYIPKKVATRFVKELGKWQKVLQTAKDRDINEADTVTIIKDLLANIFGYDKYTELTSEFAIRGTFVDLAVKIGNAVKYLIEVKAIGMDLNDNHLRQALDYGANHGIDWVVLTNGAIWRIYKIRFDKPITSEFICELDLLTMNPRQEKTQQMLFLLCKEGWNKSVIDDYHSYRKVVNKFVIGALVLNQPVLDLIKRELRRLSPDVRVDSSEIEEILKTDVLKREVIEGEMADQASSLVKKGKQRDRKKREETKEQKKQEIIQIAPSQEIHRDNSTELPS